MKNRYLDDEGKIRISTDISLPAYRKKWRGRGIMRMETRKKLRGNTGRPIKYDVKRLDIGDSFLYDKDQYMFRSHAYYWTLITGYKFTFRATPEGNRVWRVA